MSTKPDRATEAAFVAWKASLPKCLGDAGGCDGSLVGLEHEKNCPMYGKQFATHSDAFRAGYKAALDTIREKK